MNQFTAVLDSCMLYPSTLRSFLMYLAMTDLFRAKWTEKIHAEWMKNVRENYPDITKAQVEKIRDLMNSHVRDCLVTGYESLIDSLSLPDPDDRHVLAAAILSGADVIVTFNLRDFPNELLRPYGIEAVHPDDFILNQLDLAPNIVCAAAKRHRESLKNPPKSVAEYLAPLEQLGLTKSVSELKQFAAVI